MVVGGEEAVAAEEGCAAAEKDLVNPGLSGARRVNGNQGIQGRAVDYRHRYLQAASAMLRREPAVNEV